MESVLVLIHSLLCLRESVLWKDAHLPAAQCHPDSITAIFSAPTVFIIWSSFPTHSTTLNAFFLEKDNFQVIFLAGHNEKNV